MKQINKQVLQFFSTLSDETRLRIVLSLTETPLTVNQIYDEVGKNRISLSAISHQLKQMENLSIIVSEKKGREKYFSLSPDFCWCILHDAFRHFSHKCNCKAHKGKLEW